MTAPGGGIAVLLVDDHHLVRAGLRSLLERMSGIQVVGEASDGREALERIASLRPAVVVMDIAMGRLNGFEATAQIRKEFPSVRVLVLSMHAAEEYVSRAFRAGASGYLLKDAATAELEVALRAVSRGQAYLSPAISRQVVKTYLGEGGPTPDPEAPDQRLTPRQREILQLIAEGSSSKDIARALDLSVKTVEAHRAQIMARLDIHEVAGLVRYAIRAGIVDPRR